MTVNEINTEIRKARARIYYETGKMPTTLFLSRNVIDELRKCFNWWNELKPTDIDVEVKRNRYLDYDFYTVLEPDVIKFAYPE